MSDRYDTVGYGGQSVGFGDKPAVVVVDFQLGFTSPEYVSGRSPHIHRAVDNTSKLLAHARRLNIPVASCKVAWGSSRDMGYWKVPLLYEGMFYGDPSTEMNAKVYDPSYDFNFIKGAPSIFFGTPLIMFLTKNKVDTVIVTGCTTSGCVRASIVDSFSYGYRTIVPEDCVGDMEEGPHRANLLDVSRRYADVVAGAAVHEYFDRQPARRVLAEAM